ncbi:hypothetical protein Mkiyose1665_55190 [Mycobacterium kiyosense]|uniref:Uncharacterized protein n=1 Tax=Mycobacterium kiyosense TaxID=2871094 RepID=A0AA37VCB0_9MYCO|nr:hypothetical protein SRL2020028_50910 [Mycobacterium kiyosense]GLB92264.1 hypothetical protein SRL2020130_50810 [Mycobacterium kiyosense]GLB98572.1 hypothetical protein SRL2020226_53480 [Mycobacterium kiyosense]GLC04787.1 hypothetical protein SRL2020400_53780 [Mycobacterium kiyosense]GLC10219.1 hypothetical protein SRL2020411_48650 [Mycobacterium kiyosense]
MSGSAVTGAAAPIATPTEATKAMKCCRRLARTVIAPYRILALKYISQNAAPPPWRVAAERRITAARRSTAE